MKKARYAKKGYTALERVVLFTLSKILENSIRTKVICFNKVNCYLSQTESIKQWHELTNFFSTALFTYMRQVSIKMFDFGIFS